MRHGFSYEERRPDDPDEERERGRSATPANTAGVVTSNVLVTIELPPCGLCATAA
ncbi:hypothetical protein [Streptomyces catenulae]|uniref:Uncharacterized protein n=1 Tax=Streptomyces catenulae TaxID=66875 RepID=A0ABV2Z366_9ACTN|nr:hypothetical protein [Streptomyces catenulae]